MAENLPDPQNKNETEESFAFAFFRIIEKHMKIISAVDFIKHWNDFIKKKTTHKNWARHWKTEGAWSRYIYNAKDPEYDRSPLGDYLAKLYDGLGYETDPIFALKIARKQPYGITTPIQSYQQYDSYFITEPIVEEPIYSALIYDERKINLCPHKIAMLTYVRGLLKVLVTYNSVHLSMEEREEQTQSMFRTFQKLLEQKTRNTSQSEQTEYIFLIGNKTDEQITWTGKIYSNKGQEKKQE